MRLSAIAQEEFGTLAERHRRELQVHCYRLMGSISDAEDMVQETYLRAWRSRETLAEIAALRAWLYKIATNICLDTLKKRPNRSVPVTHEEASTLATPIPAEINEPIWLEPYPDAFLLRDDQHPEEYLSTKENITMAFVAALHLLPPRQRAVLILRDVMDWQASEVAALLDTTVSSVKSALHRARSTLTAYDHTTDVVTDRVLKDEESQAQLVNYVHAWETADINALIGLLKEDATFSMPPIPSWYRGKDTIQGLISMTIFSGNAQGRWRLLPTRANAQPAFGLYRKTLDGHYEAYGIQVVTIQNSLIADITTFRNPALFPYFKLPLTLPEKEQSGKSSSPTRPTRP